MTFDGKESAQHAKTDISEKPVNRPNDLVVDKHGGVYVTLTRAGQVIYYPKSGEPSVAVEKIETPNGIALSPDGSTLYVSAYVPKQVWQYPITAAGETGAGKLFAKLDPGPAKGADGMTMDRAGNVYCTGPENVWIWNPAGKLLGKIRTPTRPINCAFAGPDMRDLYITCFGGLYRQKMNAYGVAPFPPSSAADQPTSRVNRPSTEIPENLIAKLNVVYGEVNGRKLLADLFYPKSDATEKPAIVVVHGGGWLKGDKTKFRALAIELASQGYLTMAIEYRLGYEAKFPAGIQDCNAAVRYLKAHSKQLMINPQKIGAVGGSAGGHLVGLMASAWQDEKLQGDAGYAEFTSQLKAAIVMAGPMQMTTGSVAERSRKDPQKSNSNVWLGKTIDEALGLYQLADAHLHLSKETPPIMFMVGEHDVPERNAASKDKLLKLGIHSEIKVYADGKHGCWNQLPWFKTMAADMDAFFQKHL